MDRIKSCGAIVYRRSGSKVEFIAVKSKINGNWGFPKGKMEIGESEEETAKREVLEETGLNIILSDGFRRKIEYTLVEGIHKEVIFFIGETLDKFVNIQEEEIHEFKWLKYKEMLRLLTFKNSKKILSEANEFLGELNR